MEDFETLLKRSAEHHGHLCAGQVIGVRMAMLGCHLIGIDDPQKDIKKLIVYTEIDRCASDAIGSVTGCKLGRRSLKFTDYGIMAATFLNLETGQAVRICSTENSRELAKKYAPQIEDTREQQLHAYRVMPLSELFTIQDVKVNLDELDMPGPTKAKAVCEVCGATVRDGKEVIIDDRIHCRHCAGGSYYVPLKTREVEDDILNFQ